MQPLAQWPFPSDNSILRRECKNFWWTFALSDMLHLGNWTLQRFGQISIQVWHESFNVLGPFGNDCCFPPISLFLLFPPKNHPSRPLATTCDGILKQIQAFCLRIPGKGGKEMSYLTAHWGDFFFLHCPWGLPAFGSVTPSNLHQTSAGPSIIDLP